MKKQIISYIIGIIFLSIAMFSITILPVILNRVFNIYFQNSMFYELEGIFLTGCFIGFSLAPRLRKSAAYCIVVAFLYYFLFSKIYSFFI